MVHSTKSLVQTPNFDLVQLNRQFELANPNRILAWCVANIPTGLLQASAFNVDDMILTDMLYRQIRTRQPVPVLFVDTLHHFPQTQEFVDRASALYGLDLRRYQVADVKTRKAFAARYGEALWQVNLEKFHALTWSEPLQRGLSDLKAIAWITGRRRDHASHRAELPIFELDQHHRLRINPLANWTRRETWAYVFEHDVIYNPLHDQGYPSIGDEPLTTPVNEGEEERAGRWRGMPSPWEF